MRWPYTYINKKEEFILGHCTSSSLHYSQRVYGITVAPIDPIPHVGPLSGKHFNEKTNFWGGNGRGLDISVLIEFGSQYTLDG